MRLLYLNNRMFTHAVGLMELIMNRQAHADRQDAPLQENPRQHKHLTIDELRAHEHITEEEWFSELRARGVLVGGNKPWHPPQSVERIHGALARFLKERG